MDVTVMTINERFPDGISLSRQLAVDQERTDYSAQARAVLSEEDAQNALTEISSWPRYTPTPLYRLNKLEKYLGCDSIHYKDESHRFGLKSFKSLGGAYAVLKVVASQYQQQQCPRYV